MKAVTLEDVQKIFNNLVFEQPRRLNVHIWSSEHKDDEWSVKKNTEFYTNPEVFGEEPLVGYPPIEVDNRATFQMNHGLYPRK